MKEKIKIIGKGELHNKNFGNILINDNKKEEFISSVIYDTELDQYCVNGQWEIPFHQENRNESLIIENKLKKIFFYIKDIKSKNIFESTSSLKNIKESLLILLDELKKKK